MALAVPSRALAERQRPAWKSMGARGAGELLAAAERIDPLPVSVTRLALLVADPEADIREIVEVITYDQALAANLLRQVNSAALGGRVAITTVRDAVMRLGIGTLFTLALGASVRTAMGQAIPEFGLAEGDLWRHSVASSLAADVLRARCTATVPMEASTAALLHDFGKLVLARHFGGAMLTAVSSAAANDGVTEIEAETEVFGFDHAEAGAVVAGSWNLPMAVVDGIRDHHREAADLPTVSRVVALANLVADDLFAEEPVTESWMRRRDLSAALGFDADRYPELVEHAGEQYAQLAARYGVN